ncbi:hypothetical protein HPB49_026279 [Dermacentor silvarum]|nr:hypothetical protein HPB49_026279 [Dermacentor silvarum]
MGRRGRPLRCCEGPPWRRVQRGRVDRAGKEVLRRSGSSQISCSAATIRRLAGEPSRQRHAEVPTPSGALKRATLKSADLGAGHKRTCLQTGNFTEFNRQPLAPVRRAKSSQAMVYCCVPLCKSSGRTAKGITFHEFPVTELRNQWLERISRQAEGPGKNPWIPSDRSKVCSLHFKEDDFREGLKIRKLKPAAVPSVFPQYPTYLQQVAKKERRPLKRKAAKPDMSDGPLAGNSVTTAEVPAASLMPAADSPEPQEPEEIPQEPSPEALADEHSVTPALVVSPADFLPRTCDDAPPKPTSTKTNAVVRGVQTRLTFPRMQKLLKQAPCGSLVMDEMSLKQGTSYQKQSDAANGSVDLGGAEAQFGLQDQLATHLLCFVFVGLSTHYRYICWVIYVTTVLRFLQQHGQSLGAPGFQNCLPTVEFMELVHKWFVLHNIKSTTLHWTSRDAMRMPFYSADDERLSWLENDFLKYFSEWKEAIMYKMEFLSEETYEALRVTSMSTVLCTRFLLKTGFHFVLTSKFSSDDVESLFSTIRQLNGPNDQTDAYAALSSLQKILVTGIVHASTSANAGSVVGSLGKASKLFPIPVKTTSDNDVRKLLLPHLTALERYPSAPQRSLRASTLAMIAGFLVRAVQDCIECEGCLINMRAPVSHSTTTAIIAGMDRSGLSYPTLAFVGFVSRLENAASSVAPALVRGPKPLKKFTDLVLPSLQKNPLFVCPKDTPEPHRLALLRLLVQKFMRPFLANFTSDLAQEHAKRKIINAKPKSRKILKV